jgi:hypothetical protein
MMIDPLVVGLSGEHFALDYECKNDGKERIISDFHTAEYFRLMSEHIKKEVGPDVKLLPIIISSDKTVVSQGSQKTSFPCYVSIGNLKLKAMMSDGAVELVGYVPEFMDSVAVIKAVLRDNGSKNKTMQRESITLYHRYLEQEVSTLRHTFIFLRHTFIFLEHTFSWF